MSSPPDASTRFPAPDPGGSPTPGGFHALPRRDLVLTVVGLMLALLLAALDQTVVGTAMPRVVADLHGFEHYAWVTTAYLLTSTTVVPIVGKLCDLFGARAFLLGGAASTLAVVLELLLVLAGLDLVVTGALGHCPLYAKLGHVPASLKGRTS